VSGRPALVPQSDVATLLRYLKPGRVVLTVDLHSRYATLVRADGREPASSLALGRALGRAGWERLLVRKSRGRRGQQTYSADSAWVVPGGPRIPIPAEQLCETLREVLGDREGGEILLSFIQSTYDRLSRARRWREPMNLGEIKTWLDDNGFPHLMIGGKRGRNGWPGLPGRYVHRSRVNLIDPPD
jgi:hypothetical protein